jgi:hypothetical protein
MKDKIDSMEMRLAVRKAIRREAGKGPATSWMKVANAAVDAILERLKNDGS